MINSWNYLQEKFSEAQYNCYNSLKDDIFNKLIIFEHYLIGSLNILMFNKQFFEQIFKIVNLVNMRNQTGYILHLNLPLF